MPDDKCVMCREPVPKEARICPKCRFPYGGPGGPICKTCGEPLLKDALRCKTCGRYRQWWRRIFNLNTTVLSLLTAMISVFATGLIPIVSYFRHYHSHTCVVMSHADADSIILQAWNTGGQPAILDHCALEFGDRQIKGTDLLLADETKRFIAPNSTEKPVTIELKIPALARSVEDAKPGADPPVLLIDIVESSGHNVVQVPLSQYFLEEIEQKLPPA